MAVDEEVCRKSLERARDDDDTPDVDDGGAGDG